MKQAVTKEGQKLWRNPLYSGTLRNLKCPCMSGKKVKKCHGGAYAVTTLKLNEINRMITKAQKLDKIKNDIKKEKHVPNN